MVEASLTLEDARALSDRVRDAASPLLFVRGGSQISVLVEAALECAGVLLQVAEELHG